MRGDRLKEERELRGLSQEQLAERVNTSQTQISRYENGQSDPTGDVLTRLVLELECSADYLLGHVDAKQGNLELGELTPEERELLSAFRRGDFRGIMRVVADMEIEQAHDWAGITPQPGDQGLP